MPLKKGKRNMGANYKLLKREGYPKAQRTAIMLSAAGLSKKRKKGKGRKRG